MQVVKSALHAVLGSLRSLFDSQRYDLLPMDHSNNDTVIRGRELEVAAHSVGKRDDMAFGFARFNGCCANFAGILSREGPLHMVRTILEGSCNEATTRATIRLRNSSPAMWQK